MSSALGRRVLAELVGSGFLVAAVVGAGIAATRLFPGDVGLQLLADSIATGAVLVALILALQSVSAAFNPIITLVDLLAGNIGGRTALAVVAAQLAGASLGAVAANLMFGLAPVSISGHARTGGGQWLGELVATTGLVLVVRGALRSGPDRVAYAVGAYIAAAYWFTSSTSFANPAVTVARMLSDSFAGIAPASAPMFVLMQLAGGLVGYALAAALFPRRTPTGAEATDTEGAQPAPVRT